MKRFLTGAAAALLAFSTGSAVGVAPSNYQMKSPRASRPVPAARAELTRQDDSRFHWASTRGPALPLSPLSLDKRPDAAARSALGEARSLGVSTAEAETAELRELHDLGHGPIIARYQQKHEGLPVFGAQVNVMMDRNYKPVAFGGGFAKVAPAQQANPTSRSATPDRFRLA